MKIPKQPGIYSFYNTISQTIYIGSAINLRDRISYCHLKNKSSNTHLQNAIKQYGLEAFCITYWALDSAEKAKEEEQKWLDWIFKTGVKTYNIAIIAGGGRIRACYKNHRDLALKGATTEEWRIKSEALGGYKEIVGTNKYKYHFKLLNLNTGVISQEFNTTTLPSKTKGFESVSRSMLNLSIKGKLQTVNGYLVLITKTNDEPIINLKEHFLNRFKNKRIKPAVLKALEKIN